MADDRRTLGIRTLIGPTGSRPTATDWVVALAAAAALLPLTVIEVAGAGRAPTHALWMWSTLALFVTLHLVVVVRRWAGRVAVVVAAGIMLAIAILSLPDVGPTFAVMLPSSVAYLVIAATAAASDDALAAIGSAVLGIGGAAIIVVVAVQRTNYDQREAAIVLAGFLVASVAAAWAIGRYRHASRHRAEAVELGRQQADELRRRHELEALAEERRKIERDIHDVVSHSLAVMVAQAEASRLLLDGDPDGAATAMGHVIATGRDALTDIRGLLGLLAAPDGGNGAAPLRPSPRIADIRALAERASAPGRLVEYRETGRAAALAPGAEVAGFRVAQEALTNILKHTDPPTMSILHLDWRDSEVVIEVMDDGVARTGAPSSQPRGISGIRERVERCGGWLESGPREGRAGWRVRAGLPLAGGDR